MKETSDPFRQVLDDTPENREAMFQAMLKFDEPYVGPHGVKREAMPFYLGVVFRNKKLAFMVGPDTKECFGFVIASWTPWKGLTRIDLPIHEIRWVSHL